MEVVFVALFGSCFLEDDYNGVYVTKIIIILKKIFFLYLSSAGIYIYIYIYS